MKNRKAFNFYRSYYDIALELPQEDREPYLMAILKLQFEGVEPTGLEGMPRFAYLSQKHSLDKQIEGYKHGSKNRPLDHTPPRVPAPIPPRQEQVQVQEKEKEKVQEQVKEVNTPPLKKTEKSVPVRFNFKKEMLGYGFDEQLVDDWLKVRKTKRAANTQTAFDGFVKNVALCSLDKNEILRKCVEKSWQGFKAEWLEDNKPNTTGWEDIDNLNK